jgi:hypothetical protein
VPVPEGRITPRSMGSRTRNWPACLRQASRWQSWSRCFLRTQNPSRSRSRLPFGRGRRK